jgi:hypothetical protein
MNSFTSRYQSLAPLGQLKIQKFKGEPPKSKSTSTEPQPEIASKATQVEITTESVGVQVPELFFENLFRHRK